MNYLLGTTVLVPKALAGHFSDLLSLFLFNHPHRPSNSGNNVTTGSKAYLKAL